MEQNGRSSSAAGFQYDVFLSFRGTDTRHTFTRHLYDALQRQGIQTFMDSGKLETGEWIADLMHKIEVSEVFVAVISENYAKSKWCLREIAKMVDCGRWIIPVFYRVDVGHVKKLEGKFGEAFSEHETAGDLDRSEIESWKAALRAVGQKIGHVVKGSERSYINKIVEEVSHRVKIHDDIGYSVGINERVDDIKQLLALDDDDNVRIVCLYGMDGIGKTTLAKAVRSRISRNFDAYSFLEMPKKKEEEDLCRCQMRLLEDILEYREDITLVSSGKALLRIKLPCKKALIILDDVNHVDQMDALAGDLGWFGPGSRIIITTSSLAMTTYHVHNVYEVKKLNEEHSLELLSYHAFKGNQSEPGYEDLLKDVVRYACNLPLALEILGRLLRQRDKSLWKESIDAWTKSPPREISEILENKQTYSGSESVMVGNERLHCRREGFQINKIVKDAIQGVKIHHDIGYHVGISERVEEITRLLAIEDSDDVRMVCMYGVDGIGKTTLAKAVYNHVSRNFEACSFLEKVKGKDLCGCQGQLLKEIVNCQEDVKQVTKGKILLSERLRCKKALIILDDVNHEDQVDALAGDPEWFRSGSRIIVTTTRQDMRTYDKFKSGLHVYLVEKLSEKHSLELLSYHAFERHQSEPGCEELLKEVIRYACNMPLALQLLGGLLRLRRDKSEWRTSVGKWRISIPGDIKQILELSYKELQDTGHEGVFLDIACFYVGMDSKTACYIWENGIDAIRALSNRCLIKINDENKLEMHDLIRDMGRATVQEDSRLWGHDEVVSVLNDKEKMKHVEGVNVRNDIAQPSSISFCSKLSRLAHNLRWMEWHGSPLKSLSRLKLHNMVVLDLSHSKITRLWGKFPLWKWSWQENQVFTQLKVLNLSGCDKLFSTEGLSKFPNMKLLILEGCSKLEEMHPSIAGLKKLVLLNMKDCSNLVKLPDCFFGLNSLKTINLSNCSHLKNLPESICKLPALTKLLLAGCSMLNRLPDSLACLEKLEILSADQCKALHKLPDSIGGLPSLLALHLKGTTFARLPDSVCALTNLRELDLSDSKLERLPTAIGNARSLAILVLDRSRIEKLPDSIDLLGRLVKCSIVGCSRLQA